MTTMNEEQTEALTVGDDNSGQLMEVPQDMQTNIKPLTPAQARIEAVSNVLHAAYEKAAMLSITKEEADSLTAPFADEDFRTGAAGKENLIYIEHASLRDRLNSVLGVGQWAMIVRNRWAEEFDYYDKHARAYEKASRVYADVVLLIRGAFAAEAIGDMVYYPKNQQVNYGDAVEGAKSAALRRCAKDLGIGLQAWHKDFCEGWFSRRGKAPSKPVDAPQPRQAAKTYAVKKPAPEPKRLATEEEKHHFIKQCLPILDAAKNYCVEKGYILSTEDLEDLPLEKVPVGEGVRTAIRNICKWADVPMPEVQDIVTDDDHPDLVPAEEEATIPKDAKHLDGFVKMVKEKTTSKGGTAYSILIVQDMEDKDGGEWISTFDDKDGEAAKALEGCEAVVYYTPDKTGKYKNLCKRGIHPTS